ncbi:MAG: hypothetical protein KA902_03260 [Arenimonas sp.]|nr:hypothetical protein [Arenimonas sp.]
MRILFHRLLLSRPNKPKNTLLKIVFSIFGLIFILGACVIALVVGVFMLFTGLLLKLVGNKPRRQAKPTDAIDAEYSVVKKSAIPLSR